MGRKYKAGLDDQVNFNGDAITLRELAAQGSILALDYSRYFIGTTGEPRQGWFATTDIYSPQGSEVRSGYEITKAAYEALAKQYPELVAEREGIAAA